MHKIYNSLIENKQILKWVMISLQIIILVTLQNYLY